MWTTTSADGVVTVTARRTGDDEAADTNGKLMSSLHADRPARRAVLFAALAAVVGACTPGGATPPPQVYGDPATRAQAWVAAHADDPRAAAIRDRIVSRPQARWFTRADPATIEADVEAYTRPAADAGQVPILVAYTLPERDCGGASNGGAPDFPTWQAWIDGFARGLGDRRAIVVLEPDSLALQTCLDEDEVAERHAGLARAVGALRAAAPRAEVYLDAGHSHWQPAAEQARRLREAGVAEASGFASNVSNFNTTADEVAYGREVLAALGQPGDGPLRQVIDVSRNGNGPAPGGEWCDPSGRAVGAAPTLATGEPTVAALLWVKLPGESDGCAAGAGTFVPDLAHALATN